MKCKFGTGQQDITTCKMIYIHWPGYYPDELYQFALENLCPNYPKKLEKEESNLSTSELCTLYYLDYEILIWLGIAIFLYWVLT